MYHAQTDFVNKKSHKIKAKYFHYFAFYGITDKKRNGGKCGKNVRSYSVNNGVGDGIYF